MRTRVLTLCVGVLIGLLLIGRSVGHATQVTPTGTIQVAAGSDLRLGGVVSFDTTTTGLHHEQPRVQALCYQQGLLVYGEAGPADAFFLLGGSSSIWLNDSHGPADCLATLYFWSYKGSQQFNPLATVAFAAAGA